MPRTRRGSTSVGSQQRRCERTIEKLPLDLRERLATSWMGAGHETLFGMGWSRNERVHRDTARDDILGQASRDSSVIEEPLCLGGAGIAHEDIDVTGLLDQARHSRGIVEILFTGANSAAEGLSGLVALTRSPDDVIGIEAAASLPAAPGPVDSHWRRRRATPQRLRRCGARRDRLRPPHGGNRPPAAAGLRSPLIP